MQAYVIQHYSFCTILNICKQFYIAVVLVDVLLQSRLSQGEFARNLSALNLTMKRGLFPCPVIVTPHRRNAFQNFEETDSFRTIINSKQKRFRK